VTLEGHDSRVDTPAAVAIPEGAGAATPLRDHVIVAGYGVNGRNVARTLREVGIPYVVLELDTAIIRRARTAGERVLFGDVSRPEGLQDCGVDRASVVVLAISDPAATRFAVHQARVSNARVYIIARTRLVAEVSELYRLGADEVIPEEFETSIAIVARVLRRFHVPGNIVRIQERALREEGYSFLRGGDMTGSLMTSVTRMIAGATTDTYYLEADSHAVGRTLAELDLRGRTRALVIAVVRDEKHTLGPEPDFIFRAGDILVLVGDHQALDAAYGLLGQGAG
jgi:CPA2 family monovalent cation:H+ antiporter-2